MEVGRSAAHADAGEAACANKAPTGTVPLPLFPRRPQARAPPGTPANRPGGARPTASKQVARLAGPGEGRRVVDVIPALPATARLAAPAAPAPHRRHPHRVPTAVPAQSFWLAGLHRRRRQRTGAVAGAGEGGRVLQTAAAVRRRRHEGGRRALTLHRGCAIFVSVSPPGARGVCLFCRTKICIEKVKNTAPLIVCNNSPPLFSLTPAHTPPRWSARTACPAPAPARPGWPA